MTFLIGGTPRSGKTILKQILLDRYHIPGISTDLIRDALGKSMPGLGIKGYSKSDEEKSEILWPHFREIIKQRGDYKDNLLIEGTNFLPKYLQEFKDKEDIRVCFLGYSEIDPIQKFNDIRKYPSHEGEWTDNMNDDELKKLVAEFVKISQYFQYECKHCDIQYFDTSSNFHKIVEEAVAYLTNSLNLPTFEL